MKIGIICGLFFITVSKHDPHCYSAGLNPLVPTEQPGMMSIKGELNPKIKFVLFERTLKITE